mmetsp:Transcript_30170/g.33711  ORF Transcript_30170/g.33711 Transcript_30170/m.33711 type:complete len:807 (-) Transcript_30170:131-2551(-)|eukprot:CAMPEP_0168514892 /NCGR_PEP_ID=MMETSP0405-20121227/4395_1 /TAXON_ID=498012 /ORGANISM="Trichosphaerium sp, Strain Am-I-7 wt" /LENGTH=806 /DNA_ID=CAMNT_0008534135 /DNA_START=367 /DNA_END=2787 /DNA_ORIENTATION=+
MLVAILNNLGSPVFQSIHIDENSNKPIKPPLKRAKTGDVKKKSSLKKTSTSIGFSRGKRIKSPGSIDSKRKKGKKRRGRNRGRERGLTTDGDHRKIRSPSPDKRKRHANNHYTLGGASARKVKDRIHLNDEVGVQEVFKQESKNDIETETMKRLEKLQKQLEKKNRQIAAAKEELEGLNAMIKERENKLGEKQRELDALENSVDIKVKKLSHLSKRIREKRHHYKDLKNLISTHKSLTVRNEEQIMQVDREKKKRPIEQEVERNTSSPDAIQPIRVQRVTLTNGSHTDEKSETSAEIYNNAVTPETEGKPSTKIAHSESNLLATPPVAETASLSERSGSVSEDRSVNSSARERSDTTASFGRERSDTTASFDVENNNERRKRARRHWRKLSDTLTTRDDIRRAREQHERNRKAIQEQKLSESTQMFANNIQQVIVAQRIARRWVARVRIRRLKEHVMEFVRSDASKAVRNRNNVIREIYSTEETYVGKLKQMSQEYIAPMRRLKLVTNIEIESLFSDIEIITDLNEHFLKKLHERLAQWPQVTMFGDIFKEMMPLMKLYFRYIKAYLKGVTILKEARDKNSKLHDFLKEAKIKCDLHDLENFLILPVQRLPRYEMLLDTLIKHTNESHVDYDNLTQALESVKQVNQTINERNARADRLRDYRQRACVKRQDFKFVTGYLEVKILKATNVYPMDSNGLSDPFAIVSYNGKQIGKTSVKPKTLNPVWNESFVIPLMNSDKSKVITISLLDKDKITTENIGIVQVPATQYLDEGTDEPTNYSFIPDKKIKDVATVGKLVMQILHLPEHE